MKNSPLTLQLMELREHLGRGDQGIQIVIEALDHSSPRLQLEVYQLLRRRMQAHPHPAIAQATDHYKFWQHFERLNRLPNSHVQTFANRSVVEVMSMTEADLQETDTRKIAYGLRQSKWGWNHTEEKTVEAQLVEVLLNEATHPIEALVFGYWGGTSAHTVVKNLERERESLSDLKALFIGDIDDREQMISDIEQTDLRRLLSTFSNLEILHIRGDRRDHPGWRLTIGDNFTSHPGLRFGTIRHDRLTALRVETGGLNRAAIQDICRSHWPALEYLELWFGSTDYGSTSSVNDVMPILSADVLPNLKYLGLRNCEYADEMAIALAQYTPRPSLIELDFSLGTLTDIGVNALLNSTVLESLDTFNISRCYVSGQSLPRLSSLNCEVIGGPGPNASRTTISQSPRYCRVAE